MKNDRSDAVKGSGAERHTQEAGMIYAFAYLALFGLLCGAALIVLGCRGPK